MINVLNGCVLTKPVKQTIANTIKAKYSAGPNAIAHFAKIGANNTIPIKAIVLPMKELKRSSCADTVANPKKVLNNQDKGGGEKDADWILCKFTCEKNT